MLISANRYWNILVPYTLKKLNYIPEDFYYLLTTSEDLKKLITNEIIVNWLKVEKNFEYYVEQVLATLVNDRAHFQQEQDTSWLQELVQEVCFEELDMLSNSLMKIELKETAKELEGALLSGDRILSC